jgi:DNA repair protein RecO
MYTTAAIVLKSITSGEADELTSCYTRDFGKIMIKARGAKKRTTKQGNFTHPFSLLRLSFILGRNGGAILSGVRDEYTHNALAADLYACGYVSSFLRLCDEIAYEGQHDKKLWQLLVSVLSEGDTIAKSNTQDKRALLWHKEKMWLVQLLDVLGVRPSTLNIESVRSQPQLDAYLKRLLQQKFERPISFFGLYAHSA